MDTRYADEQITWLFSRSWTCATWARILSLYAEQQAELELIPELAGHAITEQIQPLIHPGPGPTDYQLQQIADMELETRHDVAAFLFWLEDLVSITDNRWGRFLAYGLTSSDLVDTALGVRFHDSNVTFWDAITPLIAVLEQGRFAHRDVPVLGRTHGQPAEPTRLGLLYEAWYEVLSRCFRDLDIRWMDCAIGKLSGPVGTYAYSPPDIAEHVLRQLNLKTSDTAMQIVPRDRIARWAASASILVDWIAKIGLDFRLAATRGEIQESYAGGRIGSSSMPHKTNPVQAEQLAGMARLAAGYASMLQTTQTWEQRDIAHSSVERVAIPDLMHVVLHSIRTLTAVLGDANWDLERLSQGIAEATRAPYSAWAALRTVDTGRTRRQARETARRWVSGAQAPGDPVIPGPPGAAWFARQHPNTPD